jgi:hypothetical protein
MPATMVPELQFAVVDSGSLDYAATPTLTFALRIESPSGHSIRSVVLDVQVQIAARQRGYDDQAQAGLLELFGPVSNWGSTLRTLPWLRTTTVVPAFSESTQVELQVPCTYDFEVTAARYLAALADGFVPLEFLFSGSVFFAGEGGGLQAVRIGWDREADYRLPVATWRQTMDRHFPHTAWLRLSTESFNRLNAYKARHTLESWDAVIASLMPESETGEA